jgi:hypothetical protein
MSRTMLTVLGLPESAIAVAKGVLDEFERERKSSP